jgi:hypothetical protein
VMAVTARTGGGLRAGRFHPSTWRRPPLPPSLPYPVSPSSARRCPNRAGSMARRSSTSWRSAVRPVSVKKARGALPLARTSMRPRDSIESAPRAGSSADPFAPRSARCAGRCRPRSPGPGRSDGTAHDVAVALRLGEGSHGRMRQVHVLHLRRPPAWRSPRRQLRLGETRFEPLSHVPAVTWVSARHH